MFSQARLKLTAWYLLILMTVSILFSAVIYQFLTREVHRFARIQRFRIERQYPGYPFTPPPVILEGPDPDLIAETNRRILAVLVIINGWIFVGSGLLGYWLAGRTLAPIEEMVREQKRFISDASHELRTPLTSLKTVFEVYLRNKKRTRTEADGIIRDSIAEVDKLHGLTQSLIILSRYQQSYATHTYAHTPINSVVHEAVTQLRPLSAKKHITIHTDVPSLTVYGNAESLTELLVILLDNAVKYSKPHTSVYVSAKKSGKYANISVRDQGIGIAKKALPHIFDRFYRADEARSQQKNGGYGLGLSIAKQIADLHGGDIIVDSPTGKGTEFTVRLPAQKNIQEKFRNA